jgi:hypothetical protein
VNYHLHLNSLNSETAAAWYAKVGDTRAVMIEGPGKEALELVEVK